MVASRHQTTDITVTADSADKDKEQSGDKDKERAEHQQYEENIRHKILEASLPFVHELGWSKNAISAGMTQGCVNYLICKHILLNHYLRSKPFLLLR